MTWVVVKWVYKPVIQEIVERFERKVDAINYINRHGGCGKLELIHEVVRNDNRVR